MIEARDTVKDATYSGDAAEQERIRQREKARGFDPDAERDAARKKSREEMLRKKSKNTTVPGENIRGDKPSAGNPSSQQQPPNRTQQTQTPPRQPAGTPSSSSSTPSSSGRTPNPYRSTGPGGGFGGGPPSGGGPKPPVVKPPMVKGLNARGVKGGGVLSGVIDTALEKSSGSGWARSLAKGATTALGTVAGGALGSFGGPVGTFAGGTVGAMAAGKAFDTVAGANAVGRKAIATDNRKSQSGGEIKGIGGSTSFSQKKPGGAAFMSTGSGPQRKTVELAKTSVVTDPKSGKQEVGNLAFKGGKAVYKRADTKSLAQTSSNQFERIGRTIAAGAYKDNDAKLAATKLATARASDATRNQKLGVKLKPGG